MGTLALVYQMKIRRLTSQGFEELIVEAITHCDDAPFTDYARSTTLVEFRQTLDL
jgi:hypothetical protein